MTLSELCIRRPVLTTLITASFIVFGVFAYRLLPVSALPRVDFPTLEITAVLPGASPETMAASVASPIERQLSTIAGISSMVSSSSLGTTRIEIAPGRARVAADPSPRQYCVRQGWLTQANSIAICAPNRVSLALVGRNRAYDSLNY